MNIDFIYFIYSGGNFENKRNKINKMNIYSVYSGRGFKRQESSAVKQYRKVSLTYIYIFIIQLSSIVTVHVHAQLHDFVLYTFESYTYPLNEQILDPRSSPEFNPCISYRRSCSEVGERVASWKALGPWTIPRSPLCLGVADTTWDSS